MLGEKHKSIITLAKNITLLFRPVIHKKRDLVSASLKDVDKCLEKVDKKRGAWLTMICNFVEKEY